MSIEAVLFDIDGTLVDSSEFHVSAWARAFQELLFPVDLSALRRQIGKRTDMLLLALALPESDRKAIADRHGRIFQTAYLSQVQAFPRGRDLIGALHAQGLKVLLASFAKQSEIDHYVDLLDVRDLISGTTSGDDVAKTKPAGDTFF
jgi:beta-phosphoglucomutase-like phosphatase (HAD superfamily)